MYKLPAVQGESAGSAPVRWRKGTFNLSRDTILLA